MTTTDFDLLVIGGGSGGVRAARMAAQRGRRVGLVESGALGGTCVNVGCIPKKLYSYAAGYGEAFAEARGYGWTAEAPAFDWATLKANRRTEITRLNGVYERLLVTAGVQLIHGRATLGGPHTAVVDGRTWRAQDILIATGGRPDVPDVPGREHLLSSDDMFDLALFPQRLLVVGAGYIACEFASIFNGLGSQVTQIHRGDLLLRGFDDDVRRFIATQMGQHGVDIRLGTTLSAVTRTASGLLAQLSDGSALAVDAILCATGRVPNLQGLGLDAVGLTLNAKGGIDVDERYRTAVPSIHAIGDVTARVQLTPVALGEAMALVDTLYGPLPGAAARHMNYEFIPTAVFTHPNIGTVGLTETEARAVHGAIRVYRSDFKPLRHTLSGSAERTLMKLIVDDASDRVVGLHMVGPEAGEVVQGFAVAMKAGATKAIFDSTIGIHPTAAEEFVTMREPVAPATVSMPA